MSVASDHVTYFRTARTDRYVDTVTITDMTSRGTWNRTTKQYDTPSTTTVYNGGALIRPAAADATNRGIQAEVLFDFFVYLPDTVTGVQVGNVVTVDASVYAADLVGAELVVQSIENDSYDVKRTLKCKYSQGGGDLG